MTLHSATGVLDYKEVEVGYRLVLEIDQGIVDFYRSLVPKCKEVKRQKYHAHVSVVRYEIPENLECWGKYQGQEVDFLYDSEIKCGKVYYWLNCFSTRLEEIRTELGLSVSSEYTKPPEGFLKCFHATIGNVK